MKGLPQNIVDMLNKNGVKKIKYFDIVSEELTLIATDKGTYKYTDTLYKKIMPHQDGWENCITKEITNKLF